MKKFKSGTYIDKKYYKAFLPELINRSWQIDDMEVIRLLSQADRQLGRTAKHIYSFSFFPELILGQ